MTERLISTMLTVHMPDNAGWINSNQRRHRMAVAKDTATWREAGRQAALKLTPITEPVHILVRIWKARSGRYDPNNLWPTVKAAIDGMVTAGLLVDDSHEWVKGPDMRHGGCGEPRLEITITPWTGEQP